MWRTINIKKKSQSDKMYTHKRKETTFRMEFVSFGFYIRSLSKNEGQKLSETAQTVIQDSWL